MLLGDPAEDELLELLDGLVRVPSPAGRELALAQWVHGWLGARPEVDCAIDEFAPGRANVLCWAAGAGSGRPPERVDLVLYSHLDTTLSGDPALDRLAVPDADLPGPLDRRGDALHGHGLVVAKGPAAAATAGFLLAVSALGEGDAKAPRLPVLLLAAGGTHRAAPPGLPLPPDAPASGAGDGVRSFLARHRPGAAIVAKCGPPALLVEEPGAACVTVEVTGRPGLAMFRASVPGGGVPGAVPAVLAGVERWRSRFVEQAAQPGARMGRDAGVGSIAAGVPYKPDLLGGVLQVHVYAVLVHGDDLHALPRDLEGSVASSLAEAGRHDLKVRVTVVDAVAAGSTPPDARIARVAASAYRSVLGRDPAQATAWTGSTDGVLFRHAGVDTVRLGPTPPPAPLGRDALSLASLLEWSRVYGTLVLDYCSGPT